MTSKQRKFKDNIIAGDNGTQAAIKAGYSAKSARVSAHRNITNDNIKVEIDKAWGKLALKTEVTVAKIQAKHQALQALAMAKQDLATATANVIAEGRTVGAYIDTANVTNTAQVQELQQLTADEAQELRRLASIRLSAITNQSISKTA